MNNLVKIGIFYDEEMKGLVDQLFGCEMPYHLPNGKPIIITLNLDDLNQQFDY